MPEYRISSYLGDGRSMRHRRAVAEAVTSVSGSYDSWKETYCGEDYLLEEIWCGENGISGRFRVIDGPKSKYVIDETSSDGRYGKEFLRESDEGDFSPAPRSVEKLWEELTDRGDDEQSLMPGMTQ